MARHPGQWRGTWAHHHLRGTPMPYATGRVIHDADSHVFETPGYVDPYLEPSLRERAQKVLRTGDETRTSDFVEKLTRKHHDPDFRSKGEEEIMLRKGFEALGSFIKEDRPQALDLLGFSSQLVFTTAYLGPLLRFERGDDMDLAYGFADAHNRAVVDFCSV